LEFKENRKIKNMYTTAGTHLLDSKKILQKIGVTQGSRVADLGCGKIGQFVYPSSEIIGEDGMVYAVDVQKEILNELKKGIEHRNLKNAQIVWADLENFGSTKIPEGTLDYIFLVTVLHQSKKQEQIIKEATRLLKIGGKLLIIDWKQDSPLAKSTTEKVDADEVMDFAKESKLKLKERMKVGRFHFGLVFEK